MPLPTDSLLQKAASDTTTTQLSAIVPKLWAPSLEKNLRRREVLQQSLVIDTSLMGTSGDTVYIASLPDLPALADLTEGTDMTPVVMSNATSVPFIPAEVGLSVSVTRKILDRMKYDGTSEVINRLGYSVTKYVEPRIANLVTASVPGTSNKLSQYYVNGKAAATITATDKFTNAAILDAKMQLEAVDNVPFDDGYYRLYITPQQYNSLIKDQDTRNDLRYASPQALLNGEVGVLHGCRIVVTNWLIQTAEGSANGVTVYNGLLIAPRWAALAWKRQPEVIVDPTMYDFGRRRKFGVTADLDIELLHNERAIVVKSA